MFRMLDGPSRKTMDAARAKLRELLQKNKHKKVLVAYIFAGHGIVELGEQRMVLNDFKKSSGFYWCYNVEAMIRNFARQFQNSFHLAFYACCRETYDPARHCGGYTGTDEEVAKQAALAK